ncbi:MAG: mechanosensitive ion channel [Eubacteriales bacterium]
MIYSKAPIITTVLDETMEVVDINVISQFLSDLPELAFQLGTRVVLAVIAFIIGVQLIKFVRKLLKKSLERSTVDTGVIQFLDSLVKALLYLVLIFMIGTSFGLDAASVIAILGSAGVAIGLAIQGSLSNFAGGVLILLQKPFVVGDYIKESGHGHEGTVTEIQLFFTKLTTVNNEIIVLPNGNLANCSLMNVTEMPNRRCDLKVGIAYNQDIRTAKAVLEGVLMKDEFVIKDKEMIVFVDELGDSAVVLGIRCWFAKADFWPGKWRLNEAVKYALDDANISIPFPQMDVHISQES